jgi:putative endonuclease
MAEHNETGKAGEELAVKYLRSKGYTILETNWRLGRNEIDIIAEADHCLVVVEVKTRHSTDFGNPESFVTREKQRLLIRAANAYIRRHSVTTETRLKDKMPRSTISSTRFTPPCKIVGCR